MARLLPASLLLLLIAGPASAQPIDWLNEQFSGPGFGPDTACDPVVGNLHLVYVNQDYPRHLVFSSGGSIALDELEDEWYGETDPEAFGPAVAFGPQDHVHLVWKSDAGADEWNLWYARRAADSWGAPVMLNQGVLRGWAPQAASDEAGVTVAATGASGDWPAAEVRAWRIIDMATTDVNLAVVPASSADRIDLVAGPSVDERYLLSGVPGPPGVVHLARSTDGGASWTHLGGVQSASCSGGAAGQPDMALAPDGDVHLVYGCAADSDAGGAPSVRHARLVGTSVQGDALIPAADNLSPGHGLARVAVSSQGTVGVIWLTRSGGSLWASSSDDGGETWHPAEQLASLAGAAEGRDAPALDAVGRVFFAVWPDGAAVHLRRGLGPIVLADDDDSGPDDDDTAGADDDDSALADDDDASSLFDDDDSADPPIPLGDPGCCGGASPSGAPAAALLLLALLPLRRRM